jgi:hypothetical protein
MLADRFLNIRHNGIVKPGARHLQGVQGQVRRKYFMPPSVSFLSLVSAQCQIPVDIRA